MNLPRLLGALFLFAASVSGETLKPKTIEAWKDYIQQTEARMERELQDSGRYLFTDFLPRHARRYAGLGDAIKQAVGEYAADVGSGAFPTDKESFSMDEAVLQGLVDEWERPATE